jgi:hypothetical protein
MLEMDPTLGDYNRSPLSILLYSHTLVIWSPKVLLAHMHAWDDIRRLMDEPERANV